jgi:hypothetical protein
MNNGQAALEALIALAVMAALAAALVSAVADAGTGDAIVDARQQVSGLRASDAAVSEALDEALSRQWFWHGNDG